MSTNRPANPSRKRRALDRETLVEECLPAALRWIDTHVGRDIDAEDAEAEARDLAGEFATYYADGANDERTWADAQRTDHPRPGPVYPPRTAPPPPGSMIDDGPVHREGRLLAAHPLATSGNAEPVHCLGCIEAFDGGKCPGMPRPETAEVQPGDLVRIGVTDDQYYIDSIEPRAWLVLLKRDGRHVRQEDSVSLRELVRVADEKGTSCSE